VSVRVCHSVLYPSVRARRVSTRAPATGPSTPSLPDALPISGGYLIRPYRVQCNVPPHRRAACLHAAAGTGLRSAGNFLESQLPHGRIFNPPLQGAAEFPPRLKTAQKKLSFTGEPFYALFVSLIARARGFMAFFSASKSLSRHCQLGAPTVPGRFILASLPSPSTSCTGITASSALLFSARRTMRWYTCPPTAPR